MVRSSVRLREGTILNNRYQIRRQIGRGGFGRTYLAEDTQRYREKCVLKEFAPQVESDRDLAKAEELFEREAGILYRLQHDRIPKFEALLRTRVEGKDSLFLVQEYIDGESYWELLERGGRFSESEVTCLLQNILPVLDYIHGQNLIHRDISPDNLIRNSDRLPVLIDFGCVKIAANALSQSTGDSVTLIGKKGYAPEEQMRNGQAFPCSDLYSLAVTILVLLTGKQPDELYDSHQGVWKWHSEVKVSPQLTKILDKMLAYNPRDRYSSAKQLIQVLEKESNFVVNSLFSRLRTLIVAPGRKTSQINSASSQTDTKFERNISRLKTKAVTLSRQSLSSFAVANRLPQWLFVPVAIATILFPGMLAFNFVRSQLSNDNIEGEILTSTRLNSQEQALQREIYRRITALNLNAGVFYSQVDDLFYEQYPELKGVPLSDTRQHQPYRQIWYQIANNLLDTRENSNSF